jgi:hypothetical protein
MELASLDDPPVDRCPFCEDDGKITTGRYDGRILLGGRGIYRCPEDSKHEWQDANEEPNTSKCGVVILR